MQGTRVSELEKNECTEGLIGMSVTSEVRRQVWRLIVCVSVNEGMLSSGVTVYGRKNYGMEIIIIIQAGGGSAALLGKKLIRKKVRECFRCYMWRVRVPSDWGKVRRDRKNFGGLLELKPVERRGKKRR